MGRTSDVSPSAANSRTSMDVASSPDTEPALQWPNLRYLVGATLAICVTVAVFHAFLSADGVLVLVVIALVLAVGLEPLTARLMSWGLPRGWAVACITVAIGLLLIVFAALVLPAIVQQVTGLADGIPRYFARLAGREDWIGRFVRNNHVTDRVRGFVRDLPSTIGRSFGSILSIAGQLGTLLFGAVTVAILTIYFMVTLPSMRRTASLLFRPRSRRRANQVIDHSIERIGGYVTGNAITSLMCAVVALLALLVMRIPFAFPLAMWAGLADLIPAVGAYLGAAPAIIVAFFVSPLVGALVLVYFIVYQQIENYVLVPRVMRNAVNLSPAAVIISTLVGGSLAGFAGALLALPVAATIKVVIVEVWLRDRVRSGDRLAKRRLDEEGVSIEP
jgi:predicted PurR-regulated permease PerM